MELPTWLSIFSEQVEIAGNGTLRLKAPCFCAHNARTECVYNVIEKPSSDNKVNCNFRNAWVDKSPLYHYLLCSANLNFPIMKSFHRRNSQPSGFVYLPHGPMKDSPYDVAKRRERADPVLSKLSSGESAAVEHATFVNVKAHFKTTGISVTYEDFAALKTRSMLNDSVLDAFFSLLQARNLEEVPRDRPDLPPCEDDDVVAVLRPRVFAFNTYLYTSLLAGGEYDYKRVERWFQKQGGDFEKLDMAMIPVNTGSRHWVLVVLNLREESVLYYDPLHGYDSTIVANCKRWLSDEFSNAGYSAASDARMWKLDNSGRTYPKQSDSSSCGIFVAFVAEAIERCDLPRFKQSDTDLLRKRALIYLLDGKM